MVLPYRGREIYSRLQVSEVGMPIEQSLKDKALPCPYLRFIRTSCFLKFAM
ncbi:hypothetical protein [Tychonema sp. LEGE 07203]|uniref:hypothetical protein n=1 Tax=Tychonema sp. LEGE 07203 TaxID=1828671 RepID=UPI00188124E7|nr:hypothetical protein [Tychonema sp. LEGE 07203]MBE9094464.1 hypothetical protein [Tychonema sp. LEGE 07203]